MRYLTSSFAGVALLASGSTVQAGGLSPEIMEAPVAVAEAPPEPASSINPTFIVIGVLAALLIAAAVAEEDDDEPVLIEPSDARLKTDITMIGTAENGLPIYSYRYIGHDALFSGVMAQDVLSHAPEAVITMPGGFYAVDYGMLGMQMERLN